MTTALARTGAGWLVAPRDMQEAYLFAKNIADSDFCPKSFNGKPGNVLAAIQMGAELGLAPLAALQNIAVINGRPSLWGDAMLALLLIHSEIDDIEETYDAATMTATCVVYRTRPGKKQRRTEATFSMAEAKAAKLTEKTNTPWSTYPKRMICMRARGFAFRDSCADILKGLITREEAQDIPPPVVHATATFVNERPEPTPEPTTEPTTVVDNAEPEVEAKHLRVWELYANATCVGQPLTSIPDDKLAGYIDRLSATIKGPGTSKNAETAARAAQASKDAVPYLMAAREEQNERDKIKREMQAEAAGADPETGEVRDAAAREDEERGNATFPETT